MDYFYYSYYFWPCVFGIYGLLFGSFFNVVLYRLPIMRERKRARGIRAAAGLDPIVEDPFSLSVPRSRCSTCGHQIRWYENIPVLSFVFLRGRCSSCGTQYGCRYVLVEILTGIVFFCAGLLITECWQP